MTNKCGRTRQRTNNLSGKLIWWMNSASELATVYYYTCRSIRGGSQSTLPGDKAWCIITPIERYSGYRHFQWKKKVLQSSMPWFCLFSHTVVNYIFECHLNTCLSLRNEFNSVYFLRFCTQYDTWFSNYRIELIVALSSTNATKRRKQKLQGNPVNPLPDHKF